MRILVDENFPQALVTWLRGEGHDVLWVTSEMPRAADTQILEFAEAEGRVLFTIDKDFEQLAHQRRTPLRWAGVVLFKIHPTSLKEIAPFVRSVAQSSTDWRGNVTIVRRTGTEMAPLKRR